MRSHYVQEAKCHELYIVTSIFNVEKYGIEAARHKYNSIQTLIQIAIMYLITIVMMTVILIKFT